MLKKKVFVSGCFDMLHSGHVRFLEEAASHGDVYVALGSDQTVRELKGRAPVTSQSERKYMLEALKHVKACLISSGSGLMDFVAELKRVKPDIFLVNEDGNTLAKAELCEQPSRPHIPRIGNDEGLIALMHRSERLCLFNLRQHGNQPRHWVMRKSQSLHR